MKLLSGFLPSDPAGQKMIRIPAEREAHCGVWKCIFPQWMTSKMTPETRLGDILLDLMLIAMYGDEHEFDYEKLGEHVAAEI